MDPAETAGGYSLNGGRIPDPCPRNPFISESSEMKGPIAARHNPDYPDRRAARGPERTSSDVRRQLFLIRNSERLPPVGRNRGLFVHSCVRRNELA